MGSIDNNGGYCCQNGFRSFSLCFSWNLRSQDDAHGVAKVSYQDSMQLLGAIPNHFHGTDVQ